jgi:CheY-like chemotaxis protein
LLVKDAVAFRLPSARMLELESAPELDVAFAPADSLAETHALPREEDGPDDALISVGMPDGDGLDLVRELEEDGGGGEPLPKLVITADPEHSGAARAMEANTSGPAFRERENVRCRGRRLNQFRTGYAHKTPRDPLRPVPLPLFSGVRGREIRRASC